MGKLLNIVHRPFGQVIRLEGPLSSNFDLACRLSLFHIERAKIIELPPDLSRSLIRSFKADSLVIRDVSAWHYWGRASSLNELNRQISHVNHAKAVLDEGGKLVIPRVRKMNWGNLKPYYQMFALGANMRFWTGLIVEVKSEKFTRIGVVDTYPFLNDYLSLINMEDFFWFDPKKDFNLDRSDTIFDDKKIVLASFIHKF